MKKALFLQSDVADPYVVYAKQRQHHSIVWNETDSLWAVYSHAACTSLLQDASAWIPPQHADRNRLLKDAGRMLVAHLARLANPPAHLAFRQAVMALFAQLQPAAIDTMLSQLLGDATETDWVATVCRTLPALAVMKGLGLAQTDIERILPHTECLTKIMLPAKTEEQVNDINPVAEEVFSIVSRHIVATPALRALAPDEATLNIYTANFIGLLIQSVDAGRGLLSNSLVQALTRRADDTRPGRQYWQQLVVETLRFDPPIHNTRRVVTQDTQLDGQWLRQGDQVLLVLAAANRDPAIFAHPNQFDPARAGNDRHLTFGAGNHACAARHWSVALAAETLATLFEKKTVRLLPQEILYAPLVNARLPQQLRIELA
ncbi:cytochrome P450 [Noviherbaspirillum saxi]|uniref:Cytochrome P450 n=1 Tax=Noviherbaspirillum saxi TaxID=2320863 RepID=A0A3A3GC83_9BURK|nr:cytochrome P450 [Noviherbaspirillum saxi]RJF99825.1 cytochrome P450 [Noviherbaspirillum saxi]